MINNDNTRAPMPEDTLPEENVSAASEDISHLRAYLAAQQDNGKPSALSNLLRELGIRP